MSFDRKQWNDRPVIFGEFNIKQGRAARQAFREDGEAGLYVCLVLSLRYADDNELVFQSVDEVEAQPMRLQQRIIYLAGEAARLNGMLGDDPDEPPAQANGHAAEPPGPSH
jgi:hypothetical protein